MLSVHADGLIRKWDLNELVKSGGNVSLNHYKDIFVTSVCANHDQTRLATADEKGNLMLTDISDLNCP